MSKSFLHKNNTAIKKENTFDMLAGKNVNNLDEELNAFDNELNMRKLSIKD